MSKEEIQKIGEYLNLKYVIARDVNSNDKLETQDRYIQQLYDAYLDLQSQLDIANNKLNKIEKLTKQLKGSARYERCMDELDYILNIIKED